ncbi:uncharacterized protein N0V89_009374 [Didymosphaeria variabile]|uniref:Uncharacterized protein n=1 Tax=Didymosphaeria variabile TaxID=1932322 RepID=A0A9W8XDP4_9PLEO|nr:uncharacterized protein N0V89_009374 [Didymosphaeria variabile]KAJ4348002.1 hypothetical protein N0V89_009374 [Didymosphaeria variabile]
MKLLTFFLATAAVVLAQDSVSATGAACEPHEDHWHCPSGVAEPTTPPAESAETGASATATAAVSTAVSASASTTEAAATACEPHGDHWHCPSGVAEPTTPPAATATGEDHDEDEHDHEATAATCEPHGDHWHCPSGVAEPTTLPAETAETTGTASTTGTVSSADSAESAAATSSQFDGAAIAAGPVGSVQMAAAGLLGLLVL